MLPRAFVAALSIHVALFIRISHAILLVAGSPGISLSVHLRMFVGDEATNPIDHGERCHSCGSRFRYDRYWIE